MVAVIGISDRQNYGYVQLIHFCGHALIRIAIKIHYKPLTVQPHGFSIFLRIFPTSKRHPYLFYAVFKTPAVNIVHLNLWSP